MASHTILENNGMYGKLEIGLTLASLPANLNFYAPEDINVVVEFKDPFAQLHYVFAFHYKDFTFKSTPPPCDRRGNVTGVMDGYGNLFDNDGPGDDDPGSMAAQLQNETRKIEDLEFLDEVETQYPWRVRFAPKVEGNWEYRVIIIVNNVNYTPQNNSWTSFYVARTSNLGFIKTRPKQPENIINSGSSNQGADCYIGFVRETGESVFPTGGNLSFYLEPYCRSIWDDLYVGSINQTALHRGNYGRLLMSGDEWRPKYNNGFIFNMEGGIYVPGQSTPGDGVAGNFDLRQNFAFLLDNLITLGYEKNVNLQLCLMTYNEIVNEVNNNENWQHHVFSLLPSLANSSYDFYTDPVAKDLFKRRLRYIISRWGYATNIFAWELLGEFDLTPGLADPARQNAVKTWINEMSTYLKAFDHNHMVALSRGNASHWEDPNSFITQATQFPTIDFNQNHTYNTTQSYLGMHYDRFYGLRFKNEMDKPTFAGEFGEITSGGGIGPWSFDKTPGLESYYYHPEFHNNIWASTFSGVDGTASTWGDWIFDNPLPQANYSGNVRDFEPLRKLVDQIDFRNTKYRAISNFGIIVPGVTLQSLGMTSNDETWLTAHGGHSYSWFNTPNSPHQYEGQINIILVNGAESFDDKLLAMGLKSDWGIYGWFQKRDNWWFNLRHGAHTSSQFNFCTWNTNNAEPTVADCNASTILENQIKADFSDVCEGEYVIDYYSAYPHRSLTMGAPRLNSNGGEIPSLKRRIFSTNRHIDFKLPQFEPLVTSVGPASSIYAPDYGYKISKVEAENYKSAYLGLHVPWEDVDLSGDFETYNRFPGATKVFYKGASDGFMHQHYFDPGINQWVHAAMINNQPVSEQVVGSMAAEHAQESAIFYRGLNSELQQYYFMTGQGWIHGNLGVIGGGQATYDNVAQASEMAATDNQVFYEGSADNKIHLYYYDYNNATWLHNPLDNSIPTEKLSGGDIKIPIGAYTNTDMVFFVNDNDEIKFYTRNSGNAGSGWTFRSINTVLPFTAGQKPAGNICPVFLDVLGSTALYCFYIGMDGDVYCLVNQSVTGPNQTYPGNSTWQHFSLNSLGQLDEKAALTGELYMDADPDKKILYYWGADNHMHRYYWDFHEWAHSAIVPCDDDNFPFSGVGGAFAKDFRIISNHFIYKGTDLRVRAMWNAKNCEKCTEQNQGRYAGSQETHSVSEQKEQEAFKKKVEFATEEIYVTVYPNPCTEKLNFICDHRSGGNMKVVLTNIFGVTLVSENMQSGEKKTIDVVNYARGIYYLQFFDHQGKMLSSQTIVIN